MNAASSTTRTRAISGLQIRFVFRVGGVEHGFDADGPLVALVYQQAVDKFKELTPDVCTMDITMPEKDGIAALKEIIELDPAARVIMCSALGQESKVLESIKLGARDFVVKPFQADRVNEAVGKALG